LKMSIPARTVQKSVRVKVEAFGHLNQLTGKKEFEVELTTPTVEGLVESLSNTYGEDFKRAIVETSSGEFTVLILVNGKDIDFLQKSKTPLSNDDKISLVPLVAGG